MSRITRVTMSVIGLEMHAIAGYSAPCAATALVLKCTMQWSGLALSKAAAMGLSNGAVAAPVDTWTHYLLMQSAWPTTNGGRRACRRVVRSQRLGSQLQL